LEVHGLSKSSMLIRLKTVKSSSLVLVVIGSMRMPMCNRFHEWLANNGKITTFIALWCPHVQVSLNLENQNLDHRNLHLMLKISYTACPCLSQLVSAQFALEMCLVAQNCQKIHKNPYFSIQGHPRSFNSVTIKSHCTTTY